MKELRQQRMGQFGLVVLLTNLVICTGCNLATGGNDSGQPAPRVTPKPSSQTLQPQVSAVSVAALRSESGAELGRTSFEVKAS